MKKKIIVVIGIIALFVGASVVSGINNDVELIEVIGNLNRDIETFYPTDDCYIRHYLPDNPANSHILAIQNEYGGGGSSGWAADVLIKFDISSIPPGTEIDSAVLSLFYYDWDMNNPAGRDINLYRITSDWEEETATWNTQPSYAPQPTTYTSVPSSAGVWIEWEVTSDVSDFISGSNANYGWKLTDENYWGTFDIPQTWLRSKDYGGNDIPYLEIEIIGNQPPGPPNINGKTSGKAGQLYAYTFVSVDPDDDDVFYEVDWGDGIVDPWDGPYDSNELITKDHIWSEQGDYIIMARAKDVNEAIGEWGTLEVTMPMNQQTNSWWFLEFLQNHPRMFPILQQLLGL